MTDKNGAPIPGPLQASLQDEPPERRRQLENLWMNLPEEGPASAPQVDEAWSELSRRIDAVDGARGGVSEAHRQRDLPDSRRTLEHPNEPRHSSRRVDRRHRRRSDRRAARIGIAVAFAAILIFAGVWMLNRPAVIEAAAGEQRTVELSDGSIVELNSQTRLRIAGSLRESIFTRSQERRVTLEGEAFFTVAPDEEPFIIETHDARVRVTGTEFNVRARTAAGAVNTGGTRVTLVSGAVEVATLSGTEAAMLDAPGAAASVESSSRITVDDAGRSLDHVLAWRHRGFAFTDTPITAILNEIERRFGLRIEPRRGVDLQEAMNLFYSRGVSPEQILNDICFEQNCRYRATSRGFALMGGADDPLQP